MDANRVVLFDSDANYNQRLDEVLHGAMAFDTNKYRAMERTSKGEGVATWMPVEKRTQTLWHTQLRHTRFKLSPNSHSTDKSATQVG